MNRTNRSYWIALTAGALVGLVAAVLIYLGSGSLATWQLDHKQGLLWEVVLKAVAGYVAIIGVVITAFKYIDEKARQREQDRNAELRQREQDRREKRKDFLQERQAVYRRLGLSLAKIMNYDPSDTEEWKLAKEKFYEIYWGQIPLVADEAVMKEVKSFSDVLYKAKTEEDKKAETFTKQVSGITEACRKSLGDAWTDINEEQMFLGRFKAAAAEGAAVELKLRVLAGKVPGLEKYAHQKHLENIEDDVAKHFGTALSADEKETLRLCRQLRNKVLHSDFHAMREVEKKIVGVKAETEGTVVADTSSTAAAGIYGWLMEVGQAGDFGCAAEAFKKAQAIVDRLVWIEQKTDFKTDIAFAK
jgi:hypothetical protein